MEPISTATNPRRVVVRWLLGSLVASAATILASGLGAPTAAMAERERAPNLDADEMLVLVDDVTRAREACYAAPECPNLEELMGLFAPSPRRTEIQRDNNVVQLDGDEALRADHVRVAQRFTGRRVETLHLEAHGRNVIAFQLNWDPGAAAPNAFTSVFRIEDGRVTNWVLMAP